MGHSAETNTASMESVRSVWAIPEDQIGKLEKIAYAEGVYLMQRTHSIHHHEGQLNLIVEARRREQLAPLARFVIDQTQAA